MAALFLLLSGAPPADAQEKNTPALFPLLYAAEEDGLPWSPSWPAELPPDAFSAVGRVASIHLEGEGWSYRLQRDRSGRITELPLIGAEGSVSLARNADGSVRTLVLPEGGAFSVLEAEDGFPRLLSADDGTWVRVERSAEGRTEAHYDGEGSVSAFFEYALRGGLLFGAVAKDTEGGVAEATTVQRDSGGLLTAYESGELRLEAVYDALGRPARLESLGDGAALAYQWDERGLLVRLLRTDPSGAAEERRYEYRLDGAGNWIERQEILMVPRFGVLVPQEPLIITRKISYF